MHHPIYSVTSFEILKPYTLRVDFDDGTSQVIDFRPVLSGQLFGPLRNLTFFEQVRLDPEFNTLVWPNDADFDPFTLHDWPEHVEPLRKLVERGLADSEAGRTMSSEEMAQRISSWAKP